jgi:hypothetical protein
VLKGRVIHDWLWKNNKVKMTNEMTINNAIHNTCVKGLNEKGEDCFGGTVFFIS